MNYYKKIKLALRGTIPLIDDRDTPDPYVSRKPGDGRGPKMTTPGDENGMGASGLGQRKRDGEPRDSESGSAGENDDNPINNDIPSQNYMFVENRWDDSNSSGKASGQGVSDLTFTDQDDPIHQNALHPRVEPTGPHNMQKFRSVFERTKKKLKGTYNG